jgi:hypothetical protein
VNMTYGESGISWHGHILKSRYLSHRRGVSHHYVKNFVNNN